MYDLPSPIPAFGHDRYGAMVAGAVCRVDAEDVAPGLLLVVHRLVGVDEAAYVGPSDALRDDGGHPKPERPAEREDAPEDRFRAEERVPSRARRSGDLLLQLRLPRVRQRCFRYAGPMSSSGSIAAT